MSLVNDMLNDLEQRRVAQPAQSENLEWLTARSPEKKISKKPLYLLLLVLMLAGAYIVFQQYYAKSALDVASNAIASSKGSAAEKVIDESVPDKIAVSAVPEKTETILETVSFESISEGLKITLQLNDQPSYQLRRENNAFVVKFDGVAKQLPLAKAVKSPVTGVSFKPVEDGMEAVFSFSGRVDLRSSLSKTVNNQLLVFVRSIASAPSAPQKEQLPKPQKRSDKNESNSPAANKEPKKTADNTVKRNAPLTVGQQDARAVIQAKKRLSINDVSGAEDILSKLLQRYPGAVQSNTLYIEIKLGQGHLELAQNRLNRMRAEFDRSSELRRLQAHAYVLADKPAEAVQLLLSQKPDLAKETAYYELLASAAQRAKQYSLAIQVYKSLLRHDSGHGQWWLGLAISQELSGLKADARANFLQALKVGRISQTLRDYAKRRYDALAGAVNVYPQSESEENNGGE